MKIYEETKLSSFKFWSSAANNAEKLTSQELDQVGEMLEELHPEGMSAVQVNDLFWFDFDTVLEWLGKPPEEEE